MIDRLTLVRHAYCGNRRKLKWPTVKREGTKKLIITIIIIIPKKKQVGKDILGAYL